MAKLYYSLLVLLLSVTTLFAQQGTVKGQVYSTKSNDPLALATVRVQGTSLGARTDVEGRFVISGVKPGFVRLIVTMLGYETTTSAEVQVVGNQTSFIDIGIEEESTNIAEVVVRPKMRLKQAESPLSLQTLGIKQIEKSAGANRDISKLVQTLPGVGATDPNRNDLIVRGGGPSENVFYLDGIEIPVINHFSTQGASGGVVGMINPDFVREISFYIIRKTSRQAQGKRSVPNPPSLRRNEAYYFYQHSDTNAPTKKKLLRRTLASEELLFCSRGLLKLHSSLVPPLTEALGELAVHLIDELTN